MREQSDRDQTQAGAEAALANALARRREALLRAHSFRLRRADLEECLGQSALELLVAVRRGSRFKSEGHAGVVLEQRFLSRIFDQRRALSGRSPMRAALERAVGLDGELCELPDRGGDIEAIVAVRERIGQIASQAMNLTPSERLVIGTQLGLPIDAQSVCSAAGWTQAKYRKTAQRARDRLRARAPTGRT